MVEEAPRRAKIEINLPEAAELVAIGVRRASAFLRLGLDGLEDRGKGDFNLAAGLNYQFWPAQLTDKDREATRGEYSSWLVGACLQQLDLFYGLFLDRIWFAIEVAGLHGTNVKSDYKFDRKFERDTNVARKHAAVAEKLGVNPHADALNSLSLARNALTHHAGVIRSTDCNNPPARDVLELQWLALDATISRGGVERLLKGEVFDTAELPSEGESELALKVGVRRMAVPAGQQFVLIPSQIAELCMFYLIMRDQVVSGLIDLLRVKRLLAPAPTPP
jgi:hypothetical protein